jgi:hypothetical protein
MPNDTAFYIAQNQRQCDNLKSRTLWLAQAVPVAKSEPWLGCELTVNCLQIKGRLATFGYGPFQEAVVL